MQKRKEINKTNKNSKLTFYTHIYTHTHTHITSNWITDLNVRAKTIKLMNINLEEKSSQSNINKQNK